MRWALLLAIGAALAACAVPHSPDQLAARESQPGQRVHVDLVRSMIAQKQYYAALAHIEEVARDRRQDTDELRLLRAQTLQHIGRLADASREFHALLVGPYAGQAYHGLGLIAVRSDLSQAVGYFNAAMKIRPTDAVLRNDLGYALMMAGRLAEARHHLATAAELDPDSARAANNLIISYLLDGQERAAETLAERAGVDAERMLELRREVSILRRVIRTRAGELQSKGSQSSG